MGKQNLPLTGAALVELVSKRVQNMFLMMEGTSEACSRVRTSMTALTLSEGKSRCSFASSTQSTGVLSASKMMTSNCFDLFPYLSTIWPRPIPTDLGSRSSRNVRTMDSLASPFDRPCDSAARDCSKPESTDGFVGSTVWGWGGRWVGACVRAGAFWGVQDWSAGLVWLVARGVRLRCAGRSAAG